MLGLINGLINGLLAAGFVLVYKSNRFLNLAHAQLGALSALLLAKFVNDQGWNFWLALAVCLPVGIATGLVVESQLVRRARRVTRSPVRLLILTVGVTQILLALTYVPGLTPNSSSGKAFPEPYTSHLRLLGVHLDGMSVLALVLVPAVLVGLTAFLGLSSMGKQIRAAANNPESALLCGISVNRVSLITWGVAGGLSALSAVLSGPTTSTFNTAAVGPQLLVVAMGAAAFGAFVSLPLAVGGGVALGLINQVVLAISKNGGTSELWVVGTILLVILVRGKEISKVFAASGAAVPERPVVRIPDVLRGDPVIRYYRWAVSVGGVAVAAALPKLPYFRANRFLLILVLVYALIGLALTMLIGWGGQISLGHFAVVGVGAYLTARWAGHGWSLAALVVVVGAVGAAVTAVVGLPALRVRGLTLAVTTIGFAVIGPEWLYRQSWLGGASANTDPVTRPAIAIGLGSARSDLTVYYLALVVLIAVVLAASSLRRSIAGRKLLAVRDNERASAAFGLTPATAKLALLALSGFVAGVAGVFFAIAWQHLNTAQFSPDASTAVLAVPVIGGLGSIGGALAASVLLYMNTFFVGPHVSRLFGSFGNNIGFLLILGGLGTVATMLQFPNGIAGEASKAWQKYLDRKAETVTRDEVPDSAADPLTVTDIVVHFGGIKALNGTAITVRRGEIVGLIGPNGAGKTTLMNVISGLLTPDAGSVRIFGREVSDLPSDMRASYGVARSFQDASLFAGLTVLETIEVAISHREKSGMIPALLAAPWVRSSDRDTRRAAEAIVQEFGLTPWADSLAGQLSTGTRRICDLAAQVAAQPKLLMLDEPTGGVAQREAEAFGPLVRRIRDDLDCSILIIEHDMPLLMGLCDRVYAMVLGEVVAEGSPEEIRNSPAVIASYLGTEETAIERSDRRPTKQAVASSSRRNS